MTARKTTEQFIREAQAIHGDRYDYSKVVYQSNKHKIDIICKLHGIFSKTPSKHLLRKEGCPLCLIEFNPSLRSTSFPVTFEEFLDRAKKAHTGKYEYRESSYTGYLNPVRITCPMHGEFIQVPKNHIKSKEGCPKCSFKERAKLRSIGLMEFVSRAKKVHLDRYHYDQVRYINNSTKVLISCSIHGDFEQVPETHLNGSGCPKCGLEKVAESSRKRALSNEKFILKSKEIHDDYYDYSFVEYINNSSKVKILCKSHGIFEQTPASHMGGRGCSKCCNKNKGETQRLTKAGFISLAKKVHGDLYFYDSVQYHNSKTKVSIQCEKHGSFLQTPNMHLYGNGCPTCALALQTSKGEIAVADYLEYDLKQKVIRNTKQIIPPREIDIYLPDHNLAIEYCGLYWHTEAMGKDKNYHLQKYLDCKEKGIRLITIFEDEWMVKQEIVKSVLQHFVGLSEKGVYARDVVIQEVPWLDAKSFLDKHHLLGAGTSGKYRIGAFHNDVLIGVMIFGAPTNERGADYSIEMKRFATDGRNHPGLGSKMTSWAKVHFEIDTIEAFVDARWFSGSFKFHSGFKEVGHTIPSFFWISPSGERLHRRFVTKEKLLGENIHGNTKRKMLEDLGYSRIWDCGKIKVSLNT